MHQDSQPSVPRSHLPLAGPIGNPRADNRKESAKNLKRFLGFLVFIPALLTALSAFGCARLLFVDVSVSYLFGVSMWHLGALLAFLYLLWLPVSLAIYDLSEGWEMGLIVARTLILIVAVSLMFPHQLVCEFLQGYKVYWNLEPLYLSLFAIVVTAYGGMACYNNSQKAFRDVRSGVARQGRTHSDRWRWFDAISIFMVLFAVIVIECWFLAAMSKGKLDFAPYECFTYAAKQAAIEGKLLCPQATMPTVPAPPLKAKSPVAPKADTAQIVSPPRGVATKKPALNLPTANVAMTKEQWQEMLSQATDSLRLSMLRLQQDLAKSDSAQIDSIQVAGQRRLKFRMTRLAWFCCGILSAVLFFLWACLPSRLMKATLVSVTFHDRDVRHVLFRSQSYIRHFIRAMLLQYPYLFVGGISLTFVFLVAPAVFTSAGRLNILDELVAADEVILALGIFFAWFSPIVLAVVSPDETFGEYFNHRLANHIMMVQGHLIFVGYGDLGKRVLEREVGWMRNSPRRRKIFFEVVTPDLKLEEICSQAVVIEHDPKDVIYSGAHNLLGDYGVVSTCEHKYQSKDAYGNAIHPVERVLVPVVIGEAKEPFVSSRVNLERADLVISMVPDEESIQEVFERAAKVNVNAIICVTRSDQISYLTYRSRHHPFVLVYPKHAQGITLGERLWAAILKVRAVRGMTGNWWPRVTVIGNNKANHYMLETLWPNLPGAHHEKSKLLQQHFAFIVTTSAEPQEHPMLVKKKKRLTYDQYLPETFITGGRYPYPMQEGRELDAIKVPTRVVNASDIYALESCLKHHRADILLINHEDVEKSLLMLSRCMRALERLKVGEPNQFKFPLLLLAAGRGDDWEQLSLGDATRYYDALCKLHNEDLANDLSYPQHAHYDHFQRELIGESIIDSLADVEEIIAGARRTLLNPQYAPAEKQSIGEVRKKSPPARFIEVNACLPNRPGALADYVARLAGIEFKTPNKNEIEELWCKANESKSLPVLLPSYQYLRHSALSQDGGAFVLTGYATLVPLVADFANDQSLVTRIFANDGRNYAEDHEDPDTKQFAVKKTAPSTVLKKIDALKPPGVPQIIDRMAARQPDRYNTVREFRQVMLDSESYKSTGSCACPAMSVCRIAAFQDYILASNNLKLQRLAAPSPPPDEELLYARNYYCCAETRPADERELPQSDSSYARVFCCCRSEHGPGMIAMVLNKLLFRSFDRRSTATRDDKDNWIINIAYFKDISCQNNHFSLNRLFGSFEKKPPESESKNSLPFPMHLLRILPIGDMKSARQWYYYIHALNQFLQPFGKFEFTWLDEKRKRHLDTEIPTFDEKNYPSRPMALIIERFDRHAEKEGFCDLCGLQPQENDCRKLRVWM